MRRLAILLILLVGMQYVLPLRLESPGTRALMTFGFLILAAVTVGELAKSIRIPKIVGYLGAGLVFGPYVSGVFDKQAAADLAPISGLAIALIAFLAGAELQWQEVKVRGRVILTMLGAEIGLSFVAIAATILLLRPLLPALGGTWLEAIVVASLVASILVVHSPAVTMALLTETGAKGEMARTTLGIVLVADVVVVLLFSGMLGVARTMLADGAAGGPGFWLLAWEILGALLIGALLGGLVSLYLRWQTGELFVFAIIVALFGVELAKAAHVETLLMLLTAGFVMENISKGRGEVLRHAMERSAAPVFVVFFALAGAKIVPREVLAMAAVAVPVVAARAFGIRAGARLGATWSSASPAVRDHAWKGLISQAGVAIGLSTILAQALPGPGAAVQGLILAVIAINETVGPIAFKRAIDAAGELPAVGTPESRETPALGIAPIAQAADAKGALP
jgi:Kef-type K+ transport system membrane component KefB